MVYERSNSGPVIPVQIAFFILLSMNNQEEPMDVNPWGDPVLNASTTTLDTNVWVGVGDDRLEEHGQAIAEQSTDSYSQKLANDFGDAKSVSDIIDEQDWPRESVSVSASPSASERIRRSPEQPFEDYAGSGNEKKDESAHQDDIGFNLNQRKHQGDDTAVETAASEGSNDTEADSDSDVFDEFEEFQQVQVPKFEPVVNIDDALKQIYGGEVRLDAPKEHILDVGSSRSRYNVIVAHSRQFGFEEKPINFRLKDGWRRTHTRAAVLGIVHEWNEVENGLSVGGESKKGWKLFNWSTGTEEATEPDVKIIKKSVGKSLLKEAGRHALELKTQRLQRERAEIEKQNREKAEKTQRLELQRSKRLANAKKYAAPEIALPQKKTFFTKLFGKKSTGISSDNMSPEPLAPGEDTQQRVDPFEFQNYSGSDEDDEDNEGYDFGYNQLGADDEVEGNYIEETDDVENVQEAKQDIGAPSEDEFAEFESSAFESPPANSNLSPPTETLVVEEEFDEFKSSSPIVLEKSEPQKNPQIVSTVPGETPKIISEDESDESDDFDEFNTPVPAPVAAPLTVVKPMQAMKPMKLMVPMKPMKAETSHSPKEDPKTGLSGALIDL
ncbi:unnamed protein product [Kuraishia capsulata CBS 1993]|uniref:Uncharacterized protein n=1 Tax=Kuraishia capsulata CBS 1993 TaxID=1382522 RepID=W6MNV7_9ASCO|nr:uncharacterized protein KUCA_T00004293001 [Kuraishia capsulata CBS 1993]CDK28311.1 unnamed protein product [Kuraishia capsulata CBS 1993]